MTDNIDCPWHLFISNQKNKIYINKKTKIPRVVNNIAPGLVQSADRQITDQCITTIDYMPNIIDYLHTTKKHSKYVKCGDKKIDGILDLHFLTAQQAQLLTIQFIALAWKKRNKNLLIITGKGHPLNGGVIKNNILIWINNSKIKPYILSASRAPRDLGGEGALHVVLKSRQN